MYGCSFQGSPGFLQYSREFIFGIHVFSYCGWNSVLITLWVTGSRLAVAGVSFQLIFYFYFYEKLVFVKYHNSYVYYRYVDNTFSVLISIEEVFLFTMERKCGSPLPFLDAHIKQTCFSSLFLSRFSCWIKLFVLIWDHVFIVFQWLSCYCLTCS